MISYYREFATSILECGSTSYEKYSSIMATRCPDLPAVAVIKRFEKPGARPITIPQHEPIKRAYVELVRDVVESEASNE